MHCPMVYGETGADWLQDSEPLLNPYFGSMMLKCGEVKTRFSPPTEAVPPKNEKLLELDTTTAAAILPGYLKLQSAMAADDHAGAKAALKAVMEITGHTGLLPDLIHKMLEAGDLEGIRRPHFETLSNALIAAVKKEPSAMPPGLMVMHCPMVYGETGADWLQDSEPLLNPYFGAMMLKCGYLKEDISQEKSGHEGHAH
jgi:Cu(I)/Ag(I) efflux system membrane fusion protein